MGYLDLARKAKEEYRRTQQGGAEPEIPAVDLIVDETVIAVLIDSTLLGPLSGSPYVKDGHRPRTTRHPCSMPPS